jgi:phytoene dehydrogenase-like protein
LRRKDLVETLARHLPAGAIRFGCRIAAIEVSDRRSHGAVLTTVDGSTMKAKVIVRLPVFCVQ